MSQRSSGRPRPASWCPRGDSPLTITDVGRGISPAPSQGSQGLPPIASPRSTPTPFKLRRFSAGIDAPSPSPTPKGINSHQQPGCYQSGGGGSQYSGFQSASNNSYNHAPQTYNNYHPPGQHSQNNGVPYISPQFLASPTVPSASSNRYSVSKVLL